MTTAAVFSIAVSIEGGLLGEVTSLKLSRSVSGMGTGGISISSLTFSTDSVVYTEKMRAPFVSAVIKWNDERDVPLPQFWVDKRSIKNGIITFTCYDTLAFADSLYFTEEDFEDTVLKSHGEINAPAVLSVVEKKMQRGDPLTVDSGGMGASCIFKSEALIGQSVSSVLRTIADCSGGYWCIKNYNTLKLIRFTGYNCSDSIDTNDYSLPDIGESMDIDGIDATLDNGKRYSSRSSSGGTGYIIDISTNGTLTEENIETLSSEVCGEGKYTYWNVEKAALKYVPDLGAAFVINGNSLITNNISAVIDSTGIICSLGANEVSGGEIGRSMGEITRKLDNTIQSGEECGNNMMITKYQGIMFIEEGD